MFDQKAEKVISSRPQAGGGGQGAHCPKGYLRNPVHGTQMPALPAVVEGMTETTDYNLTTSYLPRVGGKEISEKISRQEEDK